MSATLAELETRIAALEAERAVNVLGENQRENAARRERVESRLERMETKLDGMNSRVRSIEENLTEFKDLLVRALDGRYK